MRHFLAVMGLVAAGSCAQAQSLPAIGFPAEIEAQTGDTWNYAGKSYRLYGVQACLRGTKFSGPAGDSDCGMQSMAQLGSFFKSGNVKCTSLGPAKDGATFVACKLTVRGQELDLGEAMVVSGYGFAAYDMAAKPVELGYVVAERTAAERKRGLWAGVFVHPVKFLLGNAKALSTQQ